MTEQTKPWELTENEILKLFQIKGITATNLDVAHFAQKKLLNYLNDTGMLTRCNCDSCKDFWREFGLED